MIDWVCLFIYIGYCCWFLYASADSYREHRKSAHLRTALAIVFFTMAMIKWNKLFL